MDLDTVLSKESLVDGTLVHVSTKSRRRPRHHDIKWSVLRLRQRHHPVELLAPVGCRAGLRPVHEHAGFADRPALLRDVLPTPLELIFDALAACLLFAAVSGVNRRSFHVHRCLSFPGSRFTSFYFPTAFVPPSHAVRTAAISRTSCCPLSDWCLQP